MKNLTVILLTALIPGLVLWGCGKKGQSETVTPQKNTELRVDVEKPVTGELTEVLSYSGSLSGEEETVLRAKVSETVVSIPVSIGQPVKKGDVLIRFDLATASVQFEQARSSYELAQKTYERNANLLAAGAISQQALDQTKTQLDVAKANYDNVKNMVQVESPIDGTVTAVSVNEGDFVTAGASLVTVSKISSLKTSVSLTSTDLPKVKTGTEVQVSLADNPEIKTTGRITEIARSADPATRTFEAKIRLNSTQNFSSGLYVNVTILHKTTEPALILPVSALGAKLGKPSVFIMKPDSSVYSVNIKTGYRTTEKVTVLSGIKPEDLIVTTGTLLLKDGDKVSPAVKN